MRNVKMSIKLWIWKNMDWSGRICFKVQSQHIPGG